MATTDVKTSSLIINKLTKAQYDSIADPQDTQLYFISDDDTGSGGISETTLWTGVQSCEMGMPWTSITLSQAIENYSLIAFQFDMNGTLRTFILPRTDIGDTAGTQSNGSKIIAGPDEEYKFDCYINGSTDLKITSLAGDFGLYHIKGFK